VTYSLGVHVGTTSVAAAVAQGTRAEMVGLGDRTVAAAAAVYLRPDGLLIVGDPAARRHHLDPERVVREVRRRLGDPTPILLGGVGFDASVLLARMVTDVVSRVSAARGYPPELVMLSRPASWGPFRRELFDNVSRLAGLPESRTTTAAEAAATHYGSARRIADNAIVAVLHLGGGTCEVTVLRKTAGGFAVVGAPESMERLGGTNVDEALLNYVDHATDNALSELDITNRSTAAMLARLHRDCALAKEALSYDDDAIVPVFLPDRQVDVRLTRSTLEGLARPTLEATTGVFRKALEAADITAHDLGAVLLTGGSTRMPLLGRMVSDVVGRPVVIDRHPEFVTALGAARLAVTEPAFATQSGFRSGVGYGGESPDRGELLPAGSVDGLAMRSAAGGSPRGTGFPGPPLDEEETVMYSTAQFAPGAARVEQRPQPDDPAAPSEARPGRRAARVVAVAVVAALAVVALVIFALVGTLGIGGVIGDHQTSTLLPKPPPTAGRTAPPG
jgi:molecular chaperone DnaK (HSP70)